jgi:hypothetical protein
MIDILERLQKLRRELAPAPSAALVTDAITALISLQAECDRLRTLVAREWQDIVTAPKDGTPILLLDTGNEDGPVWIGYWLRESQLAKHWKNGWKTQHGWCAEDEPQGWMPLPTPPAPRTSGETG